jgi:hypothetical protein
MCNLCSNDPDTVKNERQLHEYAASQMRMLADKLDLIAQGKLKPHSDQAKVVSAISRNVITFLVDEWM